MPAFNEISPDNLTRRVGLPDAPVLIDVRIEEDVAAIAARVPTALPCAFQSVADLVPTLGTRPAVVICHKGLKLSHGAAAVLRSHGVAAEVLDGGMVGWSEAGLPMVPMGAYPGPLWVTRHRPKIDRIACPWLIRRFVDPTARFLFVPPAQVQDVATRFGATPFDMPDGDWSHKGTFCTFDKMVETFGLTTPALTRLATVVRAADTGRHDLAPEAAGLLAVSVGLSRKFRNDLEQLDAGMMLYDALYRWARDGQGEDHEWPEGHLS
ncbi:chromate resistance protein ChrB domain-containing protein [Litoreibacter roseus]|uniref:Sulfurtransferase n=1 Tax=Litoreibacter roseus TaxID=2601869 RepID=A0A6N6JLB6_9RHOB|nr:sulfurtransferase/chromate resistance protein [Litoreibacter roseus]GFE66670.1 sulfurtransferase [Litoreibacter roseus]